MLRRERLLLGARTRSRYGDALVNYRVTCARSCRFRYPVNFADQLSVHLPFFLGLSIIALRARRRRRICPRSMPYSRVRSCKCTLAFTKIYYIHEITMRKGK